MKTRRPPMTPLRQRMVEDMQIRNFSAHTMRAYLPGVAAFAQHFHTSPEHLGPEHVRTYQLFLVQEKQRAWLWVAVTSLVTVFLVRMSRGGQVARELLGEGFSGILVTDRYSAYNWYPVRWRQLCWAHLLRDCEAMRGRGGRSEEIGDALLAQAHQMFKWWHRVRQGTLKRSSF